MNFGVIEGGRYVETAEVTETEQRSATPSYEDSLVLLKEGWYPIEYVTHYTKLYFGREPKVTIWMRLVSQDRNSGKFLPAYFNATQLIGEEREHGQFKCSPKSRLYRGCCSVIGSNLRADRLPLTRLKEFSIQGKVITVRKDWEGEELPNGALYSRVQRFKPMNSDVDW